MLQAVSDYTPTTASTFKNCQSLLKQMEVEVINQSDSAIV